MAAEWFLEDSERAALDGVALDAFKRDVNARARRKLVLNRDMEDAEWDQVAGAMFDRTHGWLRQYETARYESYVFMVMLYFIRGIDGVDAPYVQETLRNDRIGINTRVRFLYDLTVKIVRGDY